MSGRTPLDSQPCFVLSAGMAKRVDARDLKSLSRKGVRVRVPVLALFTTTTYTTGT